MGCMISLFVTCPSVIFSTIGFKLTCDQDPRDPKPAVESSEEESSEEGEDDDVGSNKPELTREERKAVEKARKRTALAQKTATTPAPGDLPSDEDDEEIEEVPKKPVRGAGGISVTNPNAAGVVESTLNRKEREAVEAAAAKERYWKLQEQGKTDQAKADMARLTIIRQEREEKAKQRKAGTLFLCCARCPYSSPSLLIRCNYRARREEKCF